MSIWGHEINFQALQIQSKTSTFTADMSSFLTLKINQNIWKDSAFCSVLKVH